MRSMIQWCRAMGIVSLIDVGGWAQGEPMQHCSHALLVNGVYIGVSVLSNYSYLSDSDRNE